MTSHTTTLPLSQRLYTADQIARIERFAIETLGIPAFTLMQRAGEALLRVCEQRLQGMAKTTGNTDGHIIVFTGPGNNGGDGYVVASKLAQTGRKVHLLSLSDPDQLRGAAAEARDQWLRHGAIQRWGSDIPESPDLVVDALLGTGLQRPLQGDFLQAVQWINSRNSIVVSADVPSGLSADTGKILGDSVRADTTVTFIGLKIGLYSGDASDVCGTILLDDLQCPASAYEAATERSEHGSEHDREHGIEKLEPQILAELLPRRPADCHKGHFGHVLLIGGDRGMQGAIRLAAEACARSGAGLVSLATHPDHAALVSAARPEIMSHPVETAADLEPLLARASVVAIGPGLGQGAWGQSLWEAVRARSIPMVIDADALNLLAKDQAGGNQQANNRLLTPNPGEAARLLNSTTADVQCARTEAVQTIQRRYGGVVILKGKGSLIAAQQRTALWPGGNPGMASGGMGDVLTGIAAALLAQKLTPFDAATAAVIGHSLAADLASAGKPRGLLASDLFGHLPTALNPENSGKLPVHSQLSGQRPDHLAAQ